MFTKSNSFLYSFHTYKTNESAQKFPITVRKLGLSCELPQKPLNLGNLQDFEWFFYKQAGAF